MKESAKTRLVRRVELIALSVILFVCAAGLGYVVHLTEQTAQRLGASQPSLLPLIALAILAAIGGLATLSLAFRHEDAW